MLSQVVWLRYRLDAASHVRRIETPLLVLHSPVDEIVPYHLGRRVYDAASEPKRFVELRGGHNDGFLRSEPDYSAALKAFVATLPSTSRS
jgi:hypothetical protein